MARHHARAAAATLLLTLILVGLPLGLSTTIGNPLHAVPDLRAGDLSDRAIAAVLASVAWLAWATVTIAFAIEIAERANAAVRHREPRSIHIPLLGAQQALVRTLLGATVLIAAPSPATHYSHMVSAVSQATPRPAMQHTAPMHRDVAQHAATQSTYTVPATGGLWTFWDLARHYLGDGQKWPQLWSHNQGRIQADGTTMTNPQLLKPGWTVLVPAEPELNDTEPVLVHPGDTLSALAEAHGLHDWTSTWQLNRDRAESDGARFTDPNLIKPGWTLDLPAQTPSAAPTHAATPPSPPTRSTAPSKPVPDDIRSTVLDDPPAPTQPPASLAAEPPTHEHLATGHSTVTADDAVYIGGGLLLAGVAGIELARRRRRQQRSRTPGRIVPRASAALLPTEKRLLASAHDAVADVVWLEAALRNLAKSIRDQGADLPDLIAARLAANTIELVFTKEEFNPPTPWQSEDGTRWSLAREQTEPDTARPPSGCLAPYPALASVGHTSDGDTWLLDLELVAAISIEGDADRCIDLARFLAAELAHNTWSDQLQITLAGFGEELVEMNPGRLTHVPDASSAHALLARQIDAAQQDGPDLPDARLHPNDSDLWTPHILLAAPKTQTEREEVQRLVDKLRSAAGRAGVAIISAGTPDVAGTRWQLHVDTDGQVTIPALNLEVTAHRLPAGEASQLAALLAAASRDTTEPIPAARGDRPWDQLSDAIGAPRSELVESRTEGLTVPVRDTDTTTVATPEPVLPLQPSAYLDRCATTEEDLNTLAPAVPRETLEKIEAADPALDEDLASWRAAGPDRPRLAVLGKPCLTGAHGNLPEGRPREDFYTEVVVLLASRSGTTVAELATALWPHDPDIIAKTTPRQAVMIVRKWLGINPRTGREHLPHGAAGGQPGAYRLEGVLIDADLFKRLRLRGVARGSVGGIDDLEAALRLVQGMPFDRRELRSKRGSGVKVVEPYGWLVETPLDREYTAMIVDTAHIVSTHYLASGEPGKAEWAAQIAVSVDEASDIPLLDLLAAFDAQDERAQADECIRKILANHDAEIEEDLPPRTYEILRRRGWAQAS